MKKIYILFFCIFILISSAFASQLVKSGEVLYFANNKLLLNTGELVDIKKGAVIRVNNKIQKIPEIKSGQMAYAKLNPHTFEAVSVDIYDSSIKDKTRLDGLCINEFIVSYSKPLRENETLNIMLKGTSQKKAQVNVLGLASQIPLREVSPGNYKGYFKILSGYDISNATLIATLKDSEKEVSAVSTGLSFAATKPVILEASPKDNSVSTVNSPYIFISYKSYSALINTLACAMYVNGKEISCFKNNNMMLFEPKKLPKGRNTVKAIITDTAGNKTYYGWSFLINSAKQ